MNNYSALIRVIQSLAVIVLVGASDRRAVGDELNKTATPMYSAKTNWVTRWITNVIEIRMPTNLFVNEYHTNWVDQITTNVVNVFNTNWTARNLTNIVAVERVRTNFAEGYQTNWKTVTLTKTVPVEATRTNFVTSYQTNWQTFTLTKWETVIVMKTNWVSQPLTNLVEMNVPTNRVVAKEVAQPAEAKAEAPLPPPADPVTNTLVFEATRTGRAPANNQVEVQLRVSLRGDPAVTLQVQEWQVEREDGAVLFGGQDQEFKRDLPFGRYRVKVRARRDANSPILALRSEFEVTRGVVTQVKSGLTLSTRK